MASPSRPDDAVASSRIRLPLGRRPVLEAPMCPGLILIRSIIAGLRQTSVAQLTVALDRE